MTIRGIENLTFPEIQREVAQGGRFVFYEYCISVVVASTRRPTAIYFLRANDLGILRGIPYSLLSLFLGWWGLHWGLIYTPLTILTNLTGGCDVTEQVLAILEHSAPVEPAEQPQTRTDPCNEP